MDDVETLRAEAARLHAEVAALLAFCRVRTSTGYMAFDGFATVPIGGVVATNPTVVFCPDEVVATATIRMRAGLRPEESAR